MWWGRWKKPPPLSILNHQEATVNLQQAMLNLQEATINLWHAILNLQEATINLQHAILKLQEAPMNLQHAIQNLQESTTNLKDGIPNLQGSSSADLLPLHRNRLSIGVFLPRRDSLSASQTEKGQTEKGKKQGLAASKGHRSNTNCWRGEHWRGPAFGFSRIWRVGASWRLCCEGAHYSSRPCAWSRLCVCVCI